MKKTFSASILAMVLILLISTGVIAQSVTAIEMSGIENNESNEEYMAQIIKLNLEIAEAMISGNHEKSMSFYAKDLVSLPNYDKMIEGMDAMLKSNEAMQKAGWRVKAFEPKTLKVTSCDNMITEIGLFKISFTMEGMEHPVEDAGKYVTIWEKQGDGSLKIKIEIWNSDTNPMDKKM